MNSFPNPPEPQPSSSEIHDFDPCTGSFLGALRFMLQLFNDGVDAEEITILFHNHRRPVPLFFVTHVVGGTVPGPLDHAQPEQISLDMEMFALILELDRARKSSSVIQARLEDLGYYFGVAFIREIIEEEKIWHVGGAKKVKV